VELIKAVVVFGVLALLLAAGGRAVWQQEKPSLRLIVILGALLVAVLALVLGYPDVAREIFGGGGGAGLAK
jgi:small-conductance mechanosensitive channel